MPEPASSGFFLPWSDPTQQHDLFTSSVSSTRDRPVRVLLISLGSAGVPLPSLRPQWQIEQLSMTWADFYACKCLRLNILRR